MSSEDFFDLNTELAKDFSYSHGQILSSMNSLADPFALSVFSDNISKNLGDPALFPGTKNIEQQVIRILGQLFQQPTSGSGVILSGGSEANITALWAIRNKKRATTKLTGFPEVIAPQSVHISVDKAANLLGLKLVKVSTTPQYQVNLNALKDVISRNTIALIGIAGTTALGTIDPLKELNEICLDYQLDLMVDAAFGGLVFPFLPYAREKFSISFDLEALASITVDIHKMGHVPIPGGGLLWRDDSYPQSIKFTLPYLVGTPKQSTITGTRSGASGIAFLSLWNKIGFKGYQKIVETCIHNTQYFTQELMARGFLIPVEPVINILGVKTAKSFPITVEKMHQYLWDNGWTTSIVNGFLRFVIMPPTTRNHLERLLLLIDRLIDGV